MPAAASTAFPRRCRIVGCRRGRLGRRDSHLGRWLGMRPAASMIVPTL